MKGIATPPSNPIKDVRRRIRAPFRVQAKLEIIGVTASGEARKVRTIDANEWGIRIESPQDLPRVAVVLHLRAPDGSALSVSGWVIHSAQIDVDTWQGGIEFTTPEPRLSATRIDLAHF